MIDINKLWNDRIKKKLIYIYQLNTMVVHGNLDGNF